MKPIFSPFRLVPLVPKQPFFKGNTATPEAPVETPVAPKPEPTPPPNDMPLEPGPPTNPNQQPKPDRHKTFPTC